MDFSQFQANFQLTVQTRGLGLMKGKDSKTGPRAILPGICFENLVVSSDPISEPKTESSNFS